MADVVLKDVTKRFDKEVLAVDKASLEIANGEFMVIVGPSGCGKTTTLRMIAGLEEITGGTIHIGEKMVNDVPPKNRDIAMVFQNYALYPHMTVFQNMAFGLKLRKTPKKEIQSMVHRTASILGIENLLDRKPKALSGGQRQRVALGRAIVRSPKAFLFDEPLSNLDAKLRVTTRVELKALHRRLATTSIYVTHDQAEAMTLGDRICVMYDGQIQQVDSPMDVYDNPVNRFVAGFLGTPPMNFFDGKIVREQDDFFFDILAEDKIKLSEINKDALSTYAGKETVLGVRPEHFSFIPADRQDSTSLKATVKVIEPLGDRMEVHLETSRGVPFTANIDPHVRMSPEENVLLDIDTDKAHIFEPGQTGRNIMSRA